MKFCKDCNHCVLADLWDVYATDDVPVCSHPKAIDYADPVTGEMPTCRAMREIMGTATNKPPNFCGLNGNWWKKKT